MNRKKWSILFIVLYTVVMLTVGGLVIIVDPYFHFHAPMEGLSYSLEKVFYINDGVSQHFPYDAIITGTSMTRDFMTEEAEEQFGGKFVRLTYHGEAYKRISEGIRKAAGTNEDLKLVIWGLDTMWLIADKDLEGYEEYPDYLLDDIWWNDTNYLYNKEILWNDVLPEIVHTVQGKPADKFDDYTTKGAVGRAGVIANYERPPKVEKELDQEETALFFETMKSSLDQNVLPVIADHPDVTFYIFFPPYSICWWDGFHQSGEEALMRRVNIEKYAIEQLLPYDNVRLFSFFNNYELICDLDNYVDEAHYAGKISSKILTWMKEGEYELTEENYREYIEEIGTFYSNYDYDSVFSEP